MKVFVDTNVILDYILQREHYTEAKRAIAQEVAAHDTLLMSVGGFYTMLYVVDSILYRFQSLDIKIDSL